MKDYILLLPIIFIFHDMEEIIGFGRFFKKTPTCLSAFQKSRPLTRTLTRRALPSHKRRYNLQAREAHYVQRRDHSLHSFSLCPYDCKLKVRSFSYALVQQKIILRRPRFSAIASAGRGENARNND